MNTKKTPSFIELIKMMKPKTILPKIPEQLVKINAELISLPSFYYIYALMIIQTESFTSVEDAEHQDPRNSYSTNELAVIAGLLIRYGNKMDRKIPDNTEIDAIIQKNWKTIQEIHSRMSYDNPFQETIFYGEGGAYDFQYLNFLIERYGGDEAWIMEKRGFSLKTAIQIITGLTNMRFDSLKKIHGKLQENLSNYLESLCFSIQDLTDIGCDEGEVRAFLDIFSIVPGSGNLTFDDIGDHNDIYSRPILKISEDRYFLPIPTLLYSAIYKEPIGWMRSEDDDYYQKYAVPHRGDSAEEITFRLLKPVMGNGNIFRNIDVFEGKKKITDADILCFIGDKALIIQVKSQTLTHESRRGNLERIEVDYSRAIQSPQKQGDSVKKAILEKGFSFKNKEGSHFKIPRNISDAYILCVTSDPFPALSLGTLLENSERPPIPTSIFDLEVLAHYLKDPFEFLFYIHQRYLSGNKLLAISEIAILATHLKKGIYLEENQSLYIDETCQNNLNLHFLQEKGIIPANIEIQSPASTWKNERFTNLIEVLKTMEHSGTTDAILLLYGLSSEARDDIFRVMDSIVQNLTENPGKMFRCNTLVFGDNIICIAGVSEHEDLRKVLFTTCQVKKYELKGKLILGIGCSLGTGNTLRSIIYNKTPWSHDPEMEERVKVYNEKTKVASFATAGGKVVMPKRKSPCPCGSGKKYKRCCGK